MSERRPRSILLQSRAIRRLAGSGMRRGTSRVGANTIVSPVLIGAGPRFPVMEILAQRPNS
jgi:hypothetical protein